MTSGITAGVCEPVESEDCQTKNDFDPCLPITFDCDGLDDNSQSQLSILAQLYATQDFQCLLLSGTIEVDQRFPEIAVPSEETTYYCLAVRSNP